MESKRWGREKEKEKGIALCETLLDLIYSIRIASKQSILWTKLTNNFFWMSDTFSFLKLFRLQKDIDFFFDPSFQLIQLEDYPKQRFHQTNLIIESQKQANLRDSLGFFLDFYLFSSINHLLYVHIWTSHILNFENKLIHLYLWYLSSGEKLRWI